MKNILNSGTLMDVRTAEEYNTGHIDGAVNISLNQIPNRLSEIKALPRPIVAYCKSGNRSGMAIAILKQHGISDAINGGSINDVKKNFKR